jgi:hypothetical protein
MPEERISTPTPATLDSRSSHTRCDRSMKNTDKFHTAEWIVIGINVALVSGAYIFVLPRYFHDREITSILFVGLTAGAAVRASLWRWGIRLPRFWLTVAICGSVTVAIFAFSLCVILDRPAI